MRWFEHFLLTFKGDVSIVDFFVIYDLRLSCCRVCPLQPCGHLLGNGWPLDPLVCDIFLCYSHFPMCCPGSGWFGEDLVPVKCI